MSVIITRNLLEFALDEVEVTTVAVNSSTQSVLFTTADDPESYIISNPSNQICFLKFNDNTTTKQGVILQSGNNHVLLSRKGEVFTVYAIMALGGSIDISITRFF